MSQSTSADFGIQAKLLEIHRNTQDVRHQRRDRDLVLALNRSDYMLDEPSGTLLQVNLSPAWCSKLEKAVIAISMKLPL